MTDEEVESHVKSWYSGRDDGTVALSSFSYSPPWFPNVSRLLGPKQRDNGVKGEPFETGQPPLEEYREAQHPRFFFVAMAFLVFDVAAVFLFPFVLSFPRKGEAPGEALIFSAGLFFLGVVSFSLWYFKRGGSQWE